MKITNMRYLTIDYQGNVVAFYNEPDLHGSHWMDTLDDDDDLRVVLVENCVKDTPQGRFENIVATPMCLRLEEIFQTEPVETVARSTYHDMMYGLEPKASIQVPELVTSVGLIGLGAILAILTLAFTA